jgi:hypothetical protein
LKGLGGDREVKRVLDGSNAIIEHAWNCQMISAEDQSSTEDASIRPRKKLKFDIVSEMDKLCAKRDQLKVQNDILKGDLVESMVAHTQMIEQFSQQYTHEQYVRINPFIKQSVKLNQHLPDPGSSFSGFKASLTSTKGGYTMNTSSEPIVDLTIDDNEVKRRTGDALAL